MVFLVQLCLTQTFYFMKKFFLSLASLALILQACKKDEDLVEVPPPVKNEPENITTLKITFTDSAGVNPSYIAVFKDLDGSGSTPPSVFDTIYLKQNTTYIAHIVLLDETKTPADTISNDILEEAGEHIFCFSPSNVDVAIKRTDSDGGAYELGLHSRWKTGASGSGETNIVLKHQVGVKDGTCTPGDTDIEVNFKTIVQP